MKLKRLLLLVCVCAACGAVIAAAPAVCAEETERVKISVAVTDCADGEKDGKIRVSINNFEEGGTYYISVNGGRTFHKTQKKVTTLNGAKSGFYRVCARKGKDGGTLSDICTVHVGGGEEEYGVRIHVVSTGETIYRDGKLRIVIDNYDSSKSYTALVEGREPIKMDKRSVTVGFLHDGNYTVSVSDGKETSPVFSAAVKPAAAGEGRRLKAEPLLQNPELPTGCEVTSLTMLLRRMGYDADKLVLADKYLEKGEYRKTDPRKVFVGDPGEVDSYGCYAAVIKNAAEKYLEDMGGQDSWRVRNISGCAPENLYAAVDNGYPVIAWATADLKEPVKGAEWIIEETGEQYVWTAGEHCVLLTGYSRAKGLVYVNDPLTGKTAYDMALFEERFTQMGSNAVVIVKK